MGFVSFGHHNLPTTLSIDFKCGKKEIRQKICACISNQSNCFVVPPSATTTATLVALSISLSLARTTSGSFARFSALAPLSRMASAGDQELLALSDSRAFQNIGLSTEIT